MSTTNLETAREFLRALEQGVPREALARFFHPDVAQREYPNRLVAKGAERNLPALLEAHERGKKVSTSHRYEVRSAVAHGDTVAMELDWSCTLAVPVGTLPAGGTMRASCAMFITFRDGRIVSQRNYDCFEPW